MVCKEKNAHKSDIYPLEDEILASQKNMWSELRRSGFIIEEKYNRLIGRNSFTDEQKAGFIARQLVETSQGSASDMTLLGESAHCGKMQISKKIGDEDIYLINQSVTGLYEKKINLRIV